MILLLRLRCQWLFAYIIVLVEIALEVASWSLRNSYSIIQWIRYYSLLVREGLHGRARVILHILHRHELDRRQMPVIRHDVHRFRHDSGPIAHKTPTTLNLTERLLEPIDLQRMMLLLLALNRVPLRRYFLCIDRLPIHHTIIAAIHLLELLTGGKRP